jgi:hypothetical protein
MVVHALDNFGPWRLPPLAKKEKGRHPFLNECESLATMFWRLRGGGSRSNNNDNVPHMHNNYGRPMYDEYGGDEYYGQQPPRDNNMYENENYYYYDEEYPSSSSTTSKQRHMFGSSSRMLDILKNGDRKIGLPMLAAGGAITFMGISLFFNKTLMRLGNLVFIAGVATTVGPSRTAGYFLQAEKMRATACLAVGIFLVYVGSPIFGMLLELFGLLNLFGNMFPVVFLFLKGTPILGPILKTMNGSSSSSKRPKKKPREAHYDYYDEYGSRDPYDDDNDGDYNRRDYRDDRGSYDTFS